MRSFILNDNWDIQSDDAGNIAIASSQYSVAQNVATAVKLFTNDAYFDATLGIAHFETTFKRNSNYAVIRTRIQDTAMSVNGVKTAKVELKNVTAQGILEGNILITLTDGSTAEVVL